MDPVPQCLVWSYRHGGFVAEPPCEFTVFPAEARKFTPEDAITYAFDPETIGKLGTSIAVVEMVHPETRMRQVVELLLKGPGNGGSNTAHGVTG